MAVVGHWSTLAEAQKLTQSELLQGVIETIIEQGQLLPMLPVKQLNAKSLLYNREKSWAANSGASFYDINEQIPWTADVEYTAQVEVSLKRIARQDAVDKFLRATYSNINDYSAVAVKELIKRVIRYTEHMLIYGDATNGGAKQFDGLHRLVQATTAVAVASAADGDVNIDNGNAALGLSTLRMLLDTCKVEQLGRDKVFFLLPVVLARRFDAAYQEAGFVRSSVTVSLGNLQIGAREIGGRLMSFDGVPIIRSDLLVAEQADTGLSGASLRALYTSGTKNYSAFLVRAGAIEEGGLEMLFGDVGVAEGEFKPFRHEEFEKLEGFDAGGHRMVGYLAPALGALHGLGRIVDITDAALVP